MQQALLCISIDTEADCDSTWTGRSPASYSNIAALKERLGPLLKFYDAPATLLLNYDVICNDDCADICRSMRDRSGWELGTHLHGELVPPGAHYRSPAGHRFRDFQCGYPDAIEYAKLKELTDRFSRTFSAAPTSFRAGRFGAGKNTLACCAKLGYIVDTSVVPFHAFFEGPAIADFTDFDVSPQTISMDGWAIKEIPVSIRPGRFARRYYKWKRERGRGTESEHIQVAPVRNNGGFATRLKTLLARSLISSRWLRPSYSSLAEMKEVIQWIERRDGEPIVANVMFHSNELVPGMSPYNATRQEVFEFEERLHGLLRFCRDRGYQFTTLSDAAKRF